LQTSALPLGYPAGERIPSIAFNFVVSTAVGEDKNSREKAQKAQKKNEETCGTANEPLVQT
jgi:hypothetical protein